MYMAFARVYESLLELTLCSLVDIKLFSTNDQNV